MLVPNPVSYGVSAFTFWPPKENFIILFCVHCTMIKKICVLNLITLYETLFYHLAMLCFFCIIYIYIHVYMFMILIFYNANIFFSRFSLHFAIPHNVQISASMEKIERKILSIMNQITI